MSNGVESACQAYFSAAIAGRLGVNVPVSVHFEGEPPTIHAVISTGVVSQKVPPGLTVSETLALMVAPLVELAKLPAPTGSKCSGAGPDTPGHGSEAS